MSTKKTARELERELRQEQGNVEELLTTITIANQRARETISSLAASAQTIAGEANSITANSETVRMAGMTLEEIGHTLVLLSRVLLVVSGVEMLIWLATGDWLWLAKQVPMWVYALVNI